MEPSENQEKNVKMLLSTNLNNLESALKNSDNTLVAAARPLLALLISIKQTKVFLEIEYLRTQLLQQIHNFESKAKSAGYSARIILAARYCLCVVIDEAVLSTNWGKGSIWIQQSLLAIVHKETWGGEKFYIIVKKMLENEKDNIEFLELIYFLLSLGFEGKYYNEKNKREEIITNLFNEIIILKPAKTKLISPHAKTDVTNQKNQRHANLFWKLSMGIFSILLVAALLFIYKLNIIAKPLILQINELNNSFLLENATEELQISNRQSGSHPIIVRND